MDEHHEYLKVPEVANLLRVARSRVYELVGSGEIPSVRGSVVAASGSVAGTWTIDSKSSGSRARGGGSLLKKPTML